MAVVGNVNQKKNVATDRRNRQALSDIGNLALVSGVDGKLLSQISRPITRSFHARLLAKAKEVAEAENGKKAIYNNVDGALAITIGAAAGKEHEAGKPAQKKVAAKPSQKVVGAMPAQKKVATKPTQENVAAKPAQKQVAVTPETVIELSSDIEEVKQEKPFNTERTGKGSSIKKVQTMTSILTSRSKVACGLIDKIPKEQIIDIDAADANNEFAVVEYVEDLYKFYKAIENESHIHDYIGSQTEMDEKTRTIAIDWLMEVHNRFGLMPETLYLTINIFDRFLSVKTVPKRELQLVGITALLLASKYEELRGPKVKDLVYLSARAYGDQQVRSMEKTILDRLEWTLTVPTPYVFLVRFIKASIPDQEMEHMVYFYAELGMAHYETVMYTPSKLAASSVYAARRALSRKPAWDETLKAYTGYSEEKLQDCAKLLASFHLMAAENKQVKHLYEKYSQPNRSEVALKAPIKDVAWLMKQQHVCSTYVCRYCSAFVSNRILEHLDALVC